MQRLEERARYLNSQYRVAGHSLLGAKPWRERRFFADQKVACTQ